MTVRVSSVYAVCLIASVVCVDDPCATGNYREFPSQNIGARKEGCMSSVFEECDHYFNDTLWYTSTVGKLLTHCPQNRSCGSPLPAWIDGRYPDENDGKVNRSVCIKKESECCHTVLTMEIKNCSTYAVFRLPNVPSCPSAYCFESSFPCETTTTTTHTQPMTQPVTQPMTQPVTQPMTQPTTNPSTTTPIEQHQHRGDSLLTGMLIGGGVVFVCITSGIILYSKCVRKPKRICTEQVSGGK